MGGPGLQRAYLNRKRVQVDRLFFEVPGRLLALLLVVVEPRARRDQLADDHVLLQTAQPVDLAADRGFGEHPGRLLEGGGREPGGRVQGGLDQAQQHGLRRGRLAALGQRPGVGLLVLPLRDDLARQEVGVAGGVDADLPHHLPDDHFDVLVVDVDALRAVDPLHLVDQEGLDGLLAQDVQQLLGADRALGDLLAGLDHDLLAIALLQLGPDPGAVRDGVLAGFLIDGFDGDFLLAHLGLAGVAGPDQVLGGRMAGQLLALHDLLPVLDQDLHLGLQRVGDLELLPGGDLDLAGLVLADDLQLAVDLGDDRLALRDAGLEELFHAGQALRDVDAGDAAGVEGAHGQLGARFADRLGGDDAHRLPDLHQLAGRQVPAVAPPADALPGLADEHRADADATDAGFDGGASRLVADGLPGGDQHRLLHYHVLGGNPAGDPLVDRLGASRVRGDPVDPDPVGGAAVLLAHDHVLGHVGQPPGQVPGIGRPQGGVGESLARAVRGDEVLQHGQALGEVGLDRQVDDPAGGVGHQATHARQLAHLLDVAAGARAHHHPDRAELIEALFGGLGDLVGGLGPDVDDLPVALVLGHHAAAVHPLDLFDLLLGPGQDVGLVGRRRQVERGDRDAGPRRVAEPDLLDLVADGGRDVVAVEPEEPGDRRHQRLAVEVVVLELQRGLVDLGRLLVERQRLVEDDAARCRGHAVAVDPA